MPFHFPLAVRESISAQTVSETIPTKLKKSHMGRDQGSKLVMEVPKCVVLTGNLTPEGTCEPSSHRDAASLPSLPRDGKFGMSVIMSYAHELHVFELDETCPD
ncbi:hypothetical protein AVEN_104582-1 [Araneus ventricosus]|uniref:Uncharacterized protein n=1 Tax=Araneus ventricosus TaxID=182803 RepID=A0A4Y2BBC8_ARAVE|nr:hypothetical protein AVEN_104582-1 [Araneus ventricosus]